MLLLLICPKCRQRMKYQPRNGSIGKTKKCVYCGRNFTVNRENIVSHTD